MMMLDEIAQSIKGDEARIILAYAFNATGKTQLCVSYKNATKNEDGSHAGVYYNAYSEDLFVWENDEENAGADVRLNVLPSSLSKFHALLNEDNIRERLKPYRPKYGFALKLNEADPEKGIESISFFIPEQNPDVAQRSIKISRGEERIFVWCFFLALFEVEGWADKQASHFFIDDPVSSLDDHNIFVTASTVFDLIEDYHEKRKIIITTHHIGLFSILANWLTKGEKASKYAEKTKLFVLSSKSGELTLESAGKDVFLYHLRILQLLSKALRDKDVRSYHFALLRQVLENVASFLGVGQFGYVLQQIGIEDPDEVSRIVNTLAHKRVYYYESDLLVPDNLEIFSSVMEKLQAKYNFRLHAA
jgi:hypothetical protein